MKKVKDMLKSQKWLPAVALATVVLIAIVFFVGKLPVREAEAAAGQTEQATVEDEVTEQRKEQLDRTEVQEFSQAMASNMYVEYMHPIENADAFVYEQEINEEKISEKYYLMIGGINRLLYSIDFGEEKEGNWLGLLEQDSGDVYITYEIHPISHDELAAMSEKELQQYYELMDGLGTTLASIASDSRFRAEKPLAVGETKESSLTYWTVELPGNMTWTETDEDGEYQAIFYGTVQGEQVPLYTVRIGDIEAQSVLGKYRVNGIEKTLSVESFDLTWHEEWSDDDYSAAYRMMSTINDVIQVIDASEKFIPQ